MQEADLGPLTDMQVWKRMKMKKPDLSEPQPSLPTFYNNADQSIKAYKEIGRAHV